jgi:hypothetical protein
MNVEYLKYIQGSGRDPFGGIILEFFGTDSDTLRKHKQVSEISGSHKIQQLDPERNESCRHSSL